MIPKNKKISILHPHINKVWWAVKMMIFLANTLIERWNEVIFCTSSYNATLFHNIKFEVVVWNKLKIASKIKKSDYIIVWNSPMQFVAVFSKVLFFSSAKIIWWHHHYPWYYNENTNFLILIKRYLEKIALKKIDLLIANSNYLKKSLEDIYWVSVKVLTPLPDDIFLDSSKKIKKDFSNKVIFAYGRWEKGKNIEQIFYTYLFLQERIWSIKLIIWWEWEELDFYKKKFKTDKKVSFLWLIDQKSIIQNFKKSLVFLFPSKIDSFWIVVLESIYMRTPVIAFNINSSPELIDNWKNGFLVNSSKEFNEKTFELLVNKDLYKSFIYNLDSSITKDKTTFIKQLSDIL